MVLSTPNHRLTPKPVFSPPKRCATPELVLSPLKQRLTPTLLLNPSNLVLNPPQADVQPPKKAQWLRFTNTPRSTHGPRGEVWAPRTGIPPGPALTWEDMEEKG